MKQLLVEKYRPSKIDNYVFHDPAFKKQVEKWIAEKSIPNLLFLGSAGSGKTALSQILVKEMSVNPSDVKRINASLVNGIGFIREELEPWLKKRPFGSFKIVQMEEMDRLSKDAQKALRQISEEHLNTARFIATANYETGIIDAIHSRFQTVEMSTMDFDAALDFVCKILESEGISFKNDNDLLSHIEAYQPDMRKIINSIEQHTTTDSVLTALTEKSYGADIGEWEEIWANGSVIDSFNEVLQLTEHVDSSNYDWFYNVAYENHNQFSDPTQGIIDLSKYLDRAQRTANQRLTLKAFLYEAFMLEK